MLGRIFFKEIYPLAKSEFRIMNSDGSGFTQISGLQSTWVDSFSLLMNGHLVSFGRLNVTSASSHYEVRCSGSDVFMGMTHYGSLEYMVGLDIICGTPCPVGRFGASNCDLCPAGTFSSYIGSYNCTLCPAGTFSTALGAISSEVCAACPQGKLFFF